MTPNEYKEKLAALNAEFYGTSSTQNTVSKNKISIKSLSSQSYLKYMPGYAGKIYGNSDTNNTYRIPDRTTKIIYSELVQNKSSTSIILECYLRGHIGNTGYMFRTEVNMAGDIHPVFIYYTGHSVSDISKTANASGGFGNFTWVVTGTTYYSFRPSMIFDE